MKKNVKTPNYCKIVLIFICFGVSLGITWFTLICQPQYKSIVADNGVLYLINVVLQNSWKKICIIVLVIAMVNFCVLYCFLFKSKVLLDYIYKYRYVIALLILVIGTALELSGSSIAEWQKFIGGSENGTIFGTSRIMRSDDIFVWTPFAFSQYYGGNDAFSSVSHIIRGTSTNVSIVYGVPSFSLATIFRPMYWGYLILDPAKGLSYMWIFRQLLMLLGTFELAMIITKKDKWLSFAASVLISYSSIVQWWFNTSQQADVITFGCCIVVCFYYFFLTTKLWKKILYAIGLYITVGGYILIFYPASQIPIGFIIIVLSVFLLVDDKEKITFSAKNDVPLIIITVCALAGCIGYIIYSSWDVIVTTLNTSYPGQRVSCGGGEISVLFRYPELIWDTINGLDNPYSIAANVTFFDFFPLGILLAIYIWIKKKDKLLAALLIVQSIFLVYLVFGVPEWVATITMLGKSSTNAIVWGIGFVNIWLFIRSISVYDKVSIKTNILISFLFTIIISGLCWKYFKEYMFLGYGIIVSALLLFGSTYWALVNKTSVISKKLFIIYCCVICLFSGFLVNPIQKGIKEITNNSLIQAIDEINSEDEGLWLVESEAFPVNNSPLLAGAATINSTNTYPDLERWKMFDSENSSYDVYNRYAHIMVELTDQKTSFELLENDSFKIKLCYKDIRKLGVKYLLTNRIYEDEIDGIKMLMQQSGYTIYEIAY